MKSCPTYAVEYSKFHNGFDMAGSRCNGQFFPQSVFSPGKEWAGPFFPQGKKLTGQFFPPGKDLTSQFFPHPVSFSPHVIFLEKA